MSAMVRDGVVAGQRRWPIKTIDENHRKCHDGSNQMGKMRKEQAQNNYLLVDSLASLKKETSLANSRECLYVEKIVVRDLNTES
jgi:hypothetical protein